MPLSEIRHIGRRGRQAVLGLWHITEEPRQMFGQHPFLVRYREHVQQSFGNSSRQMEFLAVRALLHAIIESEKLILPSDEIVYLPSGRPTLQGCSISISHTRGRAAVVVSETCSVAVDIEQVSDRVERVGSHFIRGDESAETTVQKLMLWSAKETLYKLRSDENLHFFDMRLLGQTGPRMRLQDMRTGSVDDIVCELTPHYVLTYAVRDPQSGSTPRPSTTDSSSPCC